MTHAEALKIAGNQPRWCLLNMKRALSMLQILNTPEETKD